MEENNKKYPEGHFVGLWMAIGIAIFSGLGISLLIIIKDSGLNGILGIWPALGVSIGLAIGSAVEANYKKEGKIRPLTEKEKKRKKIAIIAGVITLLAGLLALLLAIKSQPVSNIVH